MTMKNWLRRLIQFAAALAVAYLAACVYLFAVQTQKIFDPTPDILTNPGRMGMDYEDVKIPLTSDGEQIQLDAIWIPAAGDTPAAETPSVLYLHGQDDTVGKNLEHGIRQLHALGYHVLKVDYRGYGKSYHDHKPSERSVYEDAEAAWQFLITDRGASAGRSIIYGHSLGGAIAIELASRDHVDAAALIVESTFTSINQMSQERFGGLPGILPMDLLIRHRFDSENKVGQLDLPILLIHGKADAKIPYTMSEELYWLAPDPKELMLIDGGEHANSASIASVDFKARVSAFVEKYLK